jgi:hypothetical protein
MEMRHLSELETELNGEGLKRSRNAVAIQWVDAGAERSQGKKAPPAPAAKPSARLQRLGSDRHTPEDRLACSNLGSNLSMPQRTTLVSATCPEAGGACRSNGAPADFRPDRHTDGSSAPHPHSPPSDHYSGDVSMHEPKNPTPADIEWPSPRAGQPECVWIIHGGREEDDLCATYQVLERHVADAIPR